MLNEQEEWRKSFKNKTESELTDMLPPPGLAPEVFAAWCREQEAALVRLRSGLPLQDDEELPGADEPPPDHRAAFEAALGALEAAAGAREPSVLPARPLDIPKGSAADLLEQQIATCSALIGNIASHIARDDTDASVCFPFMDRIASLLTSSAAAARVVGQLRGIASETKQTFIKKIEGEREGGVPQT